MSKLHWAGLAGCWLIVGGMINFWPEDPRPPPPLPSEPFNLDWLDDRMPTQTVTPKVPAILYSNRTCAGESMCHEVETPGCTNVHPLPFGLNDICIGYGRECNAWMTSVCSPVCGVEGTWNPCGYTPDITAKVPVLR